MIIMISSSSPSSSASSLSCLTLAKINSTCFYKYNDDHHDIIIIIIIISKLVFFFWGGGGGGGGCSDYCRQYVPWADIVVGDSMCPATIYGARGFETWRLPILCTASWLSTRLREVTRSQRPLFVLRDKLRRAFTPSCVPWARDRLPELGEWALVF